MIGNQRQQGLEVHGLWEVGNGLQAAGDLRCVRPTGIDDHWNVDESGICQLFASKAQPVLHGHIQIKENQAGDKSTAQEAHRLLAILRRNHGMATQLKQPSHRVKDGWVIVNHQHRAMSVHRFNLRNNATRKRMTSDIKEHDHPPGRANGLGSGRTSTHPALRLSGDFL